MDEKGMKIRFLQLGLLLLLAVGLIAFACIAHAETDIYATAKSEGMGYESGVGISASHLQRFNNRFAVGVGAGISSQKKKDADNGYTYSVGGHGRFYLAEPIYLSAGASYSGYRSEFENSTWEKSAWFPTLGIGYDTDTFDVSLTYYLKETQTPNEVEAISLGASLLLTRHWFLMTGITQSWFEQPGDRENDQMITVGIGWRF
jgi:hypothetical protein